MTLENPPHADAKNFYAALAKIAAGRPDCGRAIAGEDARQIARAVLIASNMGWPMRAPYARPSPVANQLAAPDLTRKALK